MDKQQDLQKLKNMFAQIRAKHEKDVLDNNSTEIEKNKRVMILLLDKIKEKKKEIETITEVVDVSNVINKDQEEKKKFFANKSHIKKNKKTNFITLLMTFFIFLYGITCTMQVFLYNHYLAIQVMYSETRPNTILNLNFSARFSGIIITTLFVIYILNYKNLKRRNTILILGSSGLILGVLSWGGILGIEGGFFSGKGYGFIPGFSILITSYLLFLNIRVHKFKKVSSLAKSKEYEEISVNLDEQKLEHFKNVEKLKKEMKKKEKQSKRSRPEGSKRPRPEGSKRPRSEGSKRPRPEGSKRPRPEGSKRPRPEGSKRPRPEEAKGI